MSEKLDKLDGSVIYIALSAILLTTSSDQITLFPSTMLFILGLLSLAQHVISRYGEYKDRKKIVAQKV